MQMNRNLFAYGTLMCADIMRSVAGYAPQPADAVLKGYRRYRVRGEHYPALVRDHGGVVEGVLYRGLDASAWTRLDRFEGDLYQRLTVQVELGDGGLASAETYLVRRELEHRLEPVEWDFAGFLRSGKQAFIREYAGYAGMRAEPD